MPCWIIQENQFDKLYLSTSEQARQIKHRKTCLPKSRSSVTPSRKYMYIFSFHQSLAQLNNKSLIRRFSVYCGYKIASKAIANRVKTVLPELISEGLSGFIKNKCISDNIRTLDSVIKYAANKKHTRASSFSGF